ncbi:MAG: lipid A deacylase LpxR family protein [Burkholderiaceae bacterium]
MRYGARGAIAFAVAAMGVGGAMPAAAQLRAFEFRLDNDQFAFTRAEDERWYSSGEFFRFGFDAPPGSPDARLAAAWCARVIACDPGSRTLRVFSLEHRIFTPTMRTATAPQPYDRPFAASLGLGAASVVLGERTRQTLEIQLGTLGPAALGEPVQNAIHSVLGQARVDGWEWQVRAQPLVQLGWSRLASTPLATRDVDAVWRTAALLGTPVTQASAGALLRWGRLPAGPSWPGDSLGVREQDGWHAYAGIEGRAVARDMTIEGEPSGYTSRVSREPFAGSAFVGASFAAFTDWRLDLSFAIHSVPFSAPVESTSHRPQRVGTIGLRWQPVR